MDIYTILAAMAIIFVGATVQFTIGFGLAIVAAPWLFLLNEDYVPAPIIMMALIISSITCYQYRENLSFKGLWSAIVGRIPGSLLGAWFLVHFHTEALSLWLGAIVIFAVAVSYSPFRLEPNQFRMGIAGFLSGFMGTTSSIGGPPMALLLQHQKAEYLRANLSAFFVFSCVMSLLVLAPIGHLNFTHLKLAAPLLPAVLLGAWVGRRFASRIPREQVRTLTMLVCFISGVSSIIAYFI
ncbi:sulfite exporter TauE/SafE family protein [Alginatibacterium sediminis]|uniref:Probable membrane transporter protein n=1 Tax=Alginatibacterium sediminis TaxID=2164068 RepID=A0A420E6A5_9ALTE|nr:sulfite exporter TauE/SafE family protein [Alginatibacterium sediminis]RKF13324.1 sulfite exporter TauE/SafE family protein [Alginatibacterium sediminis]